MIMSATNEEAIKVRFAKLPPDIKTTLQNTTIRLYGDTPKGFKFSGSGVILFSDGTETTIVSAKHNLYIYDDQKDPPAWSDNRVASFQSKVRIYYDTAMQFGKAPTQSALITSITPIDADNSDRWAYDVMILKSTDGNLNAFAATNQTGPISPTDRKLLSNPSTYLKREDKSSFIQAGYGKVRDVAEDGKKKITLPKEKAGDNIEGHLQYRFTQPNAAATVPVYNQFEADKKKYQQYINAVQLEADANSSTAPGDSGGPLFLCKYIDGGYKLFVIGVTTGADMATDKTPCPPPGQLLVNNIATSLAYCYQKNSFDPIAIRHSNRA